MNHIYRLVFNRRLGLTQVAPETAHSHGKGTRARAIVGAVAVLGLVAGPGHLLADEVYIDGSAVTVIGDGSGTQPSPWLLPGDRLFVGNTGVGTLNIENGGAVSNSEGFIGFGSSGDGSVIVTGSGSTWTNSSTLSVGENGTGTLSITNGGTVSNSFGNIGYSTGSGTVIVNDSTWTNSADLNVGRSGTGELTIENGGQVSSLKGSLGYLSASSVGIVTVTGTGSQWTTNGNALTIGEYGTGTLTITDGAAVNAGSINLAQDSDATGTLNIGAAEGSAAAAPGSLQTGSGIYDHLIFSNGTATLVFNHTATDYSFDTKLGSSGAGAHTIKVLAGTTRLTSDNATFIGQIFLSGGTLSVDSHFKLGSGFTELDFNGGTLATTGSFSTSRTVKLTGTGTLDVATGTDLTLGSATRIISGAGQLVKTGAGTLILIGDNTYTGGTTISNGTLQIGNGGTAGSIIGNVTNNAALAFNRSDDVSFAGVISGSGTLEKQGAGTLTLTGTNTYSGGTSINAGILSVSADANLGNAAGGLSFNGGTLATTADLNTNRAVALTSTGTFEVASGTTLGLNGAISGAGQLLKDGAGTLTLSGSNTYSGGTQISAGTLIGDTNSIQGDIANAGTLEFAQATDGSFAGNIAGLGGTKGTVVKSDTGTLTLDGTSSLDWTLQGGGLATAAERFTGNAILQSGTNLTFNQNSDASYGGQISGSGNFTKSGSGTLTLTGTNSHNGTLINAGTLSISADANLGNPVSTLLLDGGTLATTASFDTNRNVVLLSTGRLDVASGTTLGLQGNVLGTGPLVKTGTGTLNLTGDNSTFTGATSIEAGVLKVNGNLGGSVLVENSGTLGGNGTLGSATVQSGGTVAPGNSIGTLNVGNITFNPGSLYEVEINAAGQSDKIIASGTATINGGSVKVLAEDGNYAPSTTYTILSATGGLAGAGVFDGVTSNLAFLVPRLSYDPNNVYLTMSRNDISFRAIGQTPNQIATGGGVESLGLGNPLYDLVLGLSAPQARDAFDQLSGELHASVQGAIIQDNRWVRDAANARLRALSDSLGHGNHFWLQAIGHWGKDEGNNNAASLDRDSRGLLAGFDAQLGERGQGGFLLGKTRSDMNAGWGRGSADVDNLHLGLYGALSLNENLSLRGGAFYGQHQIDSKRSVQVRTLNNRLSDQRDAQSLQTFAELAYRASLGKMTLEPFANLANVQLHSDSSSESGGVAALNSASRDTSTSFLTLGVRPSLELDMGKTKARVYGSLGWQHAFGDTKPKVTQRFIGAGNQFSVAGTPIAKDAAAIEAGMRMELGKTSALNLSYSGQFANQAQDQSANATLEWRF